MSPRITYILAALLPTLAGMPGCMALDDSTIDAPPADCADIMARGLDSGVYTLADGRAVYCENRIAGGGFQLVSVRQRDEGVLFGDQRCLSTHRSCSGWLTEGAMLTGEGTVLLASTDGSYWLQMPSDPVLDDFLARRRQLHDTNFCHAPHFCGLLDRALPVLAHSPNFEPLSELVASLWITSGGLGLRAPDGGVIAAFNLAPYDGEDGALFIGDRDHGESAAVNGVPGALFYR